MMTVGVPREIKEKEYRVGMTPAGVGELRNKTLSILMETGAGEGSGFSNDQYRNAGAEIVDRQTLFERADLIVKVKEPLPAEYGLLREGQTIFTYLHLAANGELTEALCRKKVIALAYETLQKDHALPLLAPMSEIAGRIAPLVGSYYLQKMNGGRGILPSGSTGVQGARSLILGGGVVGVNAARISIGLGMETAVMNRGLERLQRIDELFSGRVKTLPLAETILREQLADADLVVGAILVPGGKTPVLVSRGMLKEMKKGAVIVDVSVDQGGCVETSRPTTHDDPVYTIEGIVHYAVTNMPGAYPRTSTFALTNATLPYITTLAERGVDEAVRNDPVLGSALNIYDGDIVYPALSRRPDRT